MSAHGGDSHASESSPGGSSGGSKSLPLWLVLVISWPVQMAVSYFLPGTVHLSMQEDQRSADLSVDDDLSRIIEMHDGCLPDIAAEYPFVVVVAGLYYHYDREPYLPTGNPKVEGRDKLFWEEFQLSTEDGYPEQEITVSAYIPPGTEVSGVE